LSTFQVVLVPTLLGVLANECFPKVVQKFKAFLPLVGVFLTTLLCASPCAQVATILRYGPRPPPTSITLRLTCHFVSRTSLEVFLQHQFTSL
jgi:hypothetical protein